MTPSPAFLIVGASLAGAKAAEALRAAGFDGPVILAGSEVELPYERPDLSKDYLQGKSRREKIFVHPREWYEDAGIDLRLGTTVSRIDPSGHEVSVDGDGKIGYGKLLLTTGSSPRPLPVPGADLEAVLSLRTVGDSERIKNAFAAASSVTVIGAGWIGLETAAAARAAGLAVTVLEAAELPLLRALGPEMAQVFADLHRANGVDLRCGVQVTEITGQGGRADGVLLGDGTRIGTELVIAGVGITPNTGLARDAGLESDDGVRVSAALRTADADIYAAGDVASAFHPLIGKHIRLEHWANALNQPQAAVRSMLGQEVSYDRVPYFYTDQYDLGMEYAGYAEPGGYARVVVRGDTGRREFVAFWLTADDRVLAGMNVNVWDVQDHIQQLVRAGYSGRAVDRQRLADPGVPLADLTG